MTDAGPTRCAWRGQEAPYRAYHDEEWGVPVADDERLFEMNAAYWDRFGRDCAASCAAWHHCPNPVLPPAGDGWTRFWTANPDSLEIDARLLLYYRGNGVLAGTDGRRHDCIGVAEALEITADRLRLRELSRGKHSWDLSSAICMASLGK